MKKFICLSLLTVIYTVISFGLALKSFSYGASRFNTGTLPSLGEKILNLISTVLLWPVFHPLSRWGGKLFNDIFHGLLGYVPLIINSFIWALVIYWLLEKIRINRKIT